MKSWTGLPLSFALLFLATAPGWADDLREEELIRVLTSNAAPDAKIVACQKLKICGSSRAIPALAALLGNERLSLAACDVLQSMPLPQAGRALLQALDRTAGAAEAGIIDSLGVRGETAAIPVLRTRLNAQNLQVATAAARALGKIGALDSVKPLWSAFNRPGSGVMHEAAVDGLLRCADRLAQKRQTSRARAIYERLYNSAEDEKVRIAAYAGMVRSSGTRGPSLLAAALVGRPGPAQMAALQLAHELNTPGTVLAIAALLPRVDSSIKLALLETLAFRNDPIAAPAAAELVSSPESEVRVQALKALGPLGDASSVLLLSQFAAAGTPPEQAAAREALTELKRGNVAESLVNQLATATPEVQAELVRALGDRGEQRAVPRLLYLAERAPDPARKSAIQALGLLVDQPDLPSLIRYVVTTTNATARGQASEALNTACQHILTKRGQVDVQVLVRSIMLGRSEARIALVPSCSGLISPDVRLALRSVLTDPDPRVHAAGFRALCATIDSDLIEDLVVLARTTKDRNERQQAILAGVRLATDQETVRISKGQRLARLKALLLAAKEPQEKKVVLTGLGHIPEFEALRSVEPSLEDQALQPEAAQAAIKIATSLPGSYARDSMAVLNKGLGTAPDDQSRRAIEAALKQLQDSLDYITDWMVAGPYRQVGKDASALFDAVFPPETDNAQGVDWKTIPAGTDAKRPFVLDLFKALGGRQCVAYARTWMRCDKEQPLRLEIGSDDGLRVWLNDKQVLSHNVIRTLTPGEDKVDVTLHPGWNMLLLKITQKDLRWEFCVRVVNPDGSHLENLEIESAPKTTAASNQ